jgi:hypothetical protein
VSVYAFQHMVAPEFGEQGVSETDVALITRIH